MNIYSIITRGSIFVLRPIPMPVDFQQLQTQIHQMGERAPRHDAFLKGRLDLALKTLADYAGQSDELRKRIAEAAAAHRGLRCAVPLGENLLSCVPAPPLPSQMILLAADGSQIFPDRHAAVEFGLINVGIYRLVPGSGDTPTEIVRSRLLAWDEVNPPEGPLSEDIIALERDLAERSALADQACCEKGTVIALTDGPLELYGEPKESPAYRQKFSDYLSALRRLATSHTAAGGYVDKPRADLVVRLLELVIVRPEEFDKINQIRPLHPVTDASLFEDLLAPGERSAVFGLKSTSADKFPNELGLHFFYLNVGREGRPWLARVEVPSWVVAEPALLDALHSALVSQVHMLGSRPYPYALHRAHETALVRFEEKREITDLVIRELHAKGIHVGEPSQKQSIKDLSGQRTRYS